MPRKRAPPTEVPEGERRVTRRSLQPPAPPPEKKEKAEKTPARSKGRASQPSPTPPKSRGRGRSSARGKKGKEEDEEEEEPQEEEAAAEEKEDVKEDKKSKKAPDVEKKKPAARGRASRSRGRKTAATKEPEEDQEEEKSEESKEEKPEESKEATEEATEKPEEKVEAEAEEAEAKEEVVTPKRGRGRRSAGSTPAKAETPPSSGRSSRTRTPRKSLPEETPTRRSGRKRKSAADEETPKKEEEAKPEEKMETSEEPEAEAKGEKRKREDEDEEVQKSEKKQKTEEAESTEEVSMEAADSKKEEKAAEVAPAAEAAPSEPVEEKAAGDVPAAEAPTKADAEEKKTEKPSEPDEAKQEEAASYPPADEPEEAEPEAMDTTPAAEAEKPKEAEPDVNEYVMVNKEEIPPADSAEVRSAVPPEEQDTPPQEEEPEAPAPLEPSAPPAAAAAEDSAATSQPVSVIQETPAAADEKPTENGENNEHLAVNASQDEHSKNEAAPSNNIDSVAQEPPSATIPDPLFQRRFTANPKVDPALAGNAARKFSVASYNILADCHAPLSKYQWIAPDHLSQEYRHKKLLQELQFLDADVICLQEVGPQYFESTLKPTLGALGYEGSFFKRVDDAMNEGEATFVRSSRFTVVSHQGHALRDLAFKDVSTSGLESASLAAVQRFLDKPSVVLISQLRCNNTGAVVTVANIHVSWEHLTKPDLQCIEVSEAIKQLVETATPQGAFLICGDFNSWPGTSVYQLTKEGYLSDISVSELQHLNNVRMEDGSVSPLINIWWKGFQHTASNMRSAYHEVLGVEPHTTRYPHNGWVKPVDFVWFSGNTLDTTGVLQCVSQDQLSQIPNAFFPSDHVSVKTDLVFKNV